jgi:hypothetical protein
MMFPLISESAGEHIAAVPIIANGVRRITVLRQKGRNVVEIVDHHKTSHTANLARLVCSYRVNSTCFVQ